MLRRRLMFNSSKYGNGITKEEALKRDFEVYVAMDDGYLYSVDSGIISIIQNDATNMIGVALPMNKIDMNKVIVVANNITANYVGGTLVWAPNISQDAGVTTIPTSLTVDNIATYGDFDGVKNTEALRAKFGTTTFNGTRATDWFASLNASFKDKYYMPSIGEVYYFYSWYRMTSYRDVIDKLFEYKGIIDNPYRYNGYHSSTQYNNSNYVWAISTSSPFLVTKLKSASVPNCLVFYDF